MRCSADVSVVIPFASNLLFGRSPHLGNFVDAPLVPPANCEVRNSRTIEMSSSSPTIFQSSAIRGLIEESRTSVPYAILTESVGDFQFDRPHRSQEGVPTEGRKGLICFRIKDLQVCRSIL
jgi:hypothetical protein